MPQPHGRIFNFSAGPSTLPVPVLEAAQADLLNFRETGMSVMEMSHRSAPFEEILEKAESGLRALLTIPAHYKVLFLGGGASLQFSMLPLSFLPAGKQADYIVTGAWGEKAAEAAAMVGKVNVAYSGKSAGYKEVPDFSTLPLSADAAYTHITSNETIQGVEYPIDPTSPSALVCDMSSDILSRPIDIEKYAMVYAGAQKNIGPAGVTVVIIRDDFLEMAPAKTHPMLDYRLMVKNGSMYNTPPCWNIYICGLVFDHLWKAGGVVNAQQVNKRKSGMIYDAIDSSNGFFKGHALPEFRSKMNVTFTLPNDELTKKFIKACEEKDMDGLQGHRSVGGCRASIYNAFPIEGCRLLADTMTEFVNANG